MFVPFTVRRRRVARVATGAPAAGMLVAPAAAHATAAGAVPESLGVPWGSLGCDGTTPSAGVVASVTGSGGALFGVERDASQLGVPTSDEYAIPGGRAENFYKGRMTFSFTTGRTATAVRHRTSRW
jgi:hypothetical protein